METAVLKKFFRRFAAGLIAPAALSIDAAAAA